MSISFSTTEGLKSTRTLLRRLPDTPALRLGSNVRLSGLRAPVSWAPFVSLLSYGGLANLKCVSSQ